MMTSQMNASCKHNMGQKPWKKPEALKAFVSLTQSIDISKRTCTDTANHQVTLGHLTEISRFTKSGRLDQCIALQKVNAGRGNNGFEPMP